MDTYVWCPAQVKWKTSLGSSKHSRAFVYQNFLRKKKKTQKKTSLFWAVSFCGRQDNSVVKSPHKPNSDNFFGCPAFPMKVVFSVQGGVPSERPSPYKLAWTPSIPCGCWHACEDPAPSIPLCHASLNVVVPGAWALFLPGVRGLEGNPGILL